MSAYDSIATLNYTAREILTLRPIMNKAMEQDLMGLLPSLTGPLPRELSHLAASLLAQSRSKASSMKPEEEIARGYACAHLACER